MKQYRKIVSRRVPSQLNTELKERGCEMFVVIMEEYHA